MRVLVSAGVGDGISVNCGGDNASNGLRSFGDGFALLFFFNGETSDGVGASQSSLLDIAKDETTQTFTSNFHSS